ncbi:hypothetical protein JCM16775_0750 [Leptotrichia hofstadii]|uniref:DDE-1 domain-containing protein n=3 Tax=Leptotrichia TaxID=32067 RepID=A0A510JJM7_9FUSO|nr:hypothetical protein JCM16775_0750 [Leptotrichia hofstadii]
MKNPENIDIYRKTMESEFFEEWFREIFLKDIKKLRKKVLIVMDNIRFHRKSILEKMVKETASSVISSAIRLKWMAR